MGKINTARVLLGGLVAGLIINIVEVLMNTVVLAQASTDALAARNLPPMPDAAIPVMILWCFGIGIVIVWLYAALRSHYGAGPRTAVIAGLAVWALAYLAAGIPQWLMGFFPGWLMGVSFAYGLAEMVLAALAGARMYRDSPLPSTTVRGAASAA